jgi:hypothetical protein
VRTRSQIALCDISGCAASDFDEDTCVDYLTKVWFQRWRLPPRSGVLTSEDRSSSWVSYGESNSLASGSVSGCRRYQAHPKKTDGEASHHPFVPQAPSHEKGRWSRCLCRRCVIARSARANTLLHKRHLWMRPLFPSVRTSNSACSTE